MRSKFRLVSLVFRSFASQGHAASLDVGFGRFRFLMAGRRPASAYTASRSSGCIWQHGTDVQIPLFSGAVPGILYTPIRRPDCILIMAPGSNGGMGPGIDAADRGLPLSKRTSRAARNSIYARLGASFANSLDLSFDGDVLAPQGPQFPVCAGLQISWRHCVSGAAWPKRKLKHLSSLRIAAEDIVAAVSFMRERYGEVPVILIGFSFGGPAVWAAAQRCEVHGMIALASSARGGERFEHAGLDTEAGIRAAVHRNLPVLWLHGLADRNVDPAVTAHFSSLAERQQETAATTSELAVIMIRACGHMFDSSRILAYQVLRAWLISIFGGPAEWPLGLGLGPKATTKPAKPCLRLLLGSQSRAEALDLPEVNREKLRKKHLKGYSE